MSHGTTKVTIHCNPEFNRFNLNGNTVLSQKGFFGGYLKTKKEYNHTVTVGGENYNVTFSANFHRNVKTLEITGPKEALEIFFVNTAYKAGYVRKNADADSGTGGKVYALDNNSFTSTSRNDRCSQQLLTWLFPPEEGDYLCKYRDPKTGQLHSTFDGLDAGSPKRCERYNPVVMIRQDLRRDKDSTSLTNDEILFLLKSDVTQQDIKNNKKKLIKLLEQQSHKGFKPENFPEIFNCHRKDGGRAQVFEMGHGETGDSPWTELEKNPKLLFEKYQEIARLLLRVHKIVVALEFIREHNIAAAKNNRATIEFHGETKLGDPTEQADPLTSAYGSNPPLIAAKTMISQGFNFSASPRKFHEAQKEKHEKDIARRAEEAKKQDEDARAKQEARLKALSSTAAASASRQRSRSVSIDDRNMPGASAPDTTPATQAASCDNARNLTETDFDRSNGTPERRNSVSSL